VRLPGRRLFDVERGEFVSIVGSSQRDAPFPWTPRGLSGLAHLRWLHAVPARDGDAVQPHPRSAKVACRDWARALRRANLRRIRFHDLRHTYASLPIAQGAHPKYIQAQLGHASIQTTLDRYGHLTPQIHEAEARKLDRLVFGHGPVLGGVESVMPDGSLEADALQRSQNGHKNDEGVSGGNRHGDGGPQARFAPGCFPGEVRVVGAGRAAAASKVVDGWPRGAANRASSGARPSQVESTCACCVRLRRAEGHRPRAFWAPAPGWSWGAV